MFHTVLDRYHLEIAMFFSVFGMFEISHQDASFTEKRVCQLKFLVAEEQIKTSIGDLLAYTCNPHDVIRCHLLLCLKVSKAKAFRVDNGAFNCIDHSKTDAICW